MPDPRIHPFKPLNFEVALYPISAGPTVDVRYKSSLLPHLHVDFPTMNSIPGGVEFVDNFQGRRLTIDQTHVEAEDSSLEDFRSSAERIESYFQKVLDSKLYLKPPYRVRMEARGTIEPIGPFSAGDALNRAYGPEKPWFPKGTVSSAVRFVVSEDTGLRDIRIEPMFADTRQFFVWGIGYSGHTGFETIREAVEFSRQEAEDLRKISEQITGDLLASLESAND